MDLRRYHGCRNLAAPSSLPLRRPGALSSFILYTMHKIVLVLLSLLAVVNSAPLSKRDAPGSGFVKQNGLDAQKQNAQFLTMKSSDACQGTFPISFNIFFNKLSQAGSTACIDGGFAECLYGKWIIQPCDHNLYCFALPLINSPGVSLTCDTAEDAAARISNAIGTNVNVSVPSGSSPTQSLPSSTLHSTNSLPSSSTTPSDGSGDDECDCDDDGNCIDDDPPAGDDDCMDESEPTPTPLTMAVSTATVLTSSRQAVPASSASHSSSSYSHGRRQAYGLVPPDSVSSAVAAAETSSMPIVAPTSTSVAGGSPGSTVTVVSTSISTVTVGCSPTPTPFVSQVANDPGVGFVSFGFITVSAAEPSGTAM